MKTDFLRRARARLRRGADDLLLLAGAAALCRGAFLQWGEAAAWGVAGAYCLAMAVLIARGGRKR